jgi:hypothetical protein
LQVSSKALIYFCRPASRRAGNIRGLNVAFNDSFGLIARMILPQARRLDTEAAWNGG